ncbi:MAG TPA: DUF5615 family PIN-like protein [Gemmataceae bacterium]|jgi:predicted nuclease of predicted toxin-antitoxin system
MRLYLDDDTASPPLANLLRKSGHDVCLPIEVNMFGSRDTDHFRFAVRESRVCMTRNYGDFKALHDLVLEVGGHHPGILVVRLDNDVRRDLKPGAIVRALAKLEAAEVSLVNQYIALNAWQ